MNREQGIREAGRGFVLITGAKLWFLVTATFTSLAFPRLFGDPAAFGRFRVVSGILNVVTMVVITASVQAVSKLCSETGADARRVGRTALIGQALFFGPVFFVFIAMSGLVADRFLADPAISLPLRVSSLVVLAYIVYSAVIGILNGTRNFGRQAGMDILFSTLKTGLMIAAVVATGSVAWAFGAFALTAWTVLGVSAVLVFRVVSRQPRGDASDGLLGRYMWYLLPLAGYALVLNLLLQADVIGIKASLGQQNGQAAGADSASIAAGIYGAAKNIALLPYQAVISLTFIVFPLVSRASSSGDREGASSVVSGAFRLSAVLSWGAVAMFGAAPGSLMKLLFGPTYESGAGPLVILLAAGALLAFMYVANAVLASSGKPVVSVAGGIGAVAVQLVLLAVMLPGAGADAVAMKAGWATLAGSAAGSVVAGFLVVRMYRDLSWVLTTVSALAAAAAGSGIGLLMGAYAPGVPWVVRPVAAAIVFVVVLVLTRGIRRADMDVILRVLNRRSQKTA